MNSAEINIHGNWKALKNRHLDSVFILASGPSAGSFPLQEYRNSKFITANGSIALCVQHQIKPLFYLCNDLGFVRDRPQMVLLGLSHATHLAFSSEIQDYLLKAHPDWLHGKTILPLHRVNRHPQQTPKSDRAYAWSTRNDSELIHRFSLFHAKLNRIGFSKNLDKGYFCARTIPYAGLQLAYYLGFRRCFLVGMDLSPQQGRFYEQGTQALPSTLLQDYGDYIQPSFTLLREKIINRENFQVFNLSLESRLPDSIIPKMDLQTLRTQLSETAREALPQ